MASTGWPSATPRRSSTAGATHTGRAPESTQTGRDRLVRAARDERRLALGRDRQAERLIGMRRAVAGEAAEVGAEGRCGERLGAHPDALAAAQVVGAAVHGARRWRAAGRRRSARDCACGRRRKARRRLAQEGIHRVGERGLGALPTFARTLCDLREAQQHHGLAVDDLAALDHGDCLSSVTSTTSMSSPSPATPPPSRCARRPVAARRRTPPLGHRSRAHEASPSASRRRRDIPSPPRSRANPASASLLLVEQPAGAFRSACRRCPLT